MEFNDPSIISAVLPNRRDGTPKTSQVFSGVSPRNLTSAATGPGDSNMDQFMSFIKLSEELRANNGTSSSLDSTASNGATANATVTTRFCDRYSSLLKLTATEPDPFLDFKPDFPNKLYIYSINDLLTLSKHVSKDLLDQKLMDLPKRKFWRLHQRHQEYTSHKGMNYRTNSNSSINSTGNKSTSSLNTTTSNLSTSKWRTFSGEGNKINNNNDSNNSNNSNSNNDNNNNNTGNTNTTVGSGSISSYERRNSRVKNMRSGLQTLSGKKQSQLGYSGNVTGTRTNGNNADGDGNNNSNNNNSSGSNRVNNGFNTANVIDSTVNTESNSNTTGSRRVSSAGSGRRNDREKADFMQEVDATFEQTGNSAADFEAWRAKMKEIDRQKRTGSGSGGGNDTRTSRTKSPKVVTNTSDRIPNSGGTGSGGLRASSISHTSNSISDFLNMSRRATAHGDNTSVESTDRNKESSKPGKNGNVDTESSFTENDGHEMGSRSSSSRFASFFRSSEVAKKEGTKTPLGEEAVVTSAATMTTAATAAATTTTTTANNNNNNNKNNTYNNTPIGGSKLMNFFRDSMDSNTPPAKSIETNSSTVNPASSLATSTGNVSAPQQGLLMDPQQMNPSNSNNIFFAKLLNKNKVTVNDKESLATSSSSSAAAAVLMAPPGLTGPLMPMPPMNNPNFTKELPPGLQFPPGPPGPHMMPPNFAPQMMPGNPPPPGIVSFQDNRGNSNGSVNMRKSDGPASLTNKERSASNNSNASNTGNTAGSPNGSNQPKKSQGQQQQQQQQQQFFPMMGPPMGFMPMPGSVPNMQFPIAPPKVGFPPHLGPGQGQMQPSFPPPPPGNMAMGPAQQPRNISAGIPMSTNGNALPPNVPRNSSAGAFVPGGNMQEFFPPNFIPPQQLQQSSQQRGQQQPMNMPMRQR